LDQVPIALERFEPQELEALLERDRARGFALDRAPLMRLALGRAGERGARRVLWTFHHAQLDGRSWEMLLREVFAFYESFLCGKDAQLPLPRPYRDYIEWLGEQDYARAKAFWQEALSGFRAPTALAVAGD